LTQNELAAVLDARTLDLIEQRHVKGLKRRGWLVRRALFCADVLGLSMAFLLAEFFFVHRGGGVDKVGPLGEYVLFFASLPLWIVAAKLYGLYERDEERTDHSTVEDMIDVFHLVTVGVWLLYAVTSIFDFGDPTVGKLFTFWVLAFLSVAGFRILARVYCRRHVSYVQNTLVIGAGDVGQLVARKFQHHHEYGLNLVGFVDDDPKERRDDLGPLVLLGGYDDVPRLVDLLDVERVIFAFSNERAETDLALIRSLDALGVQIDIIPRLFDILTPTATLHQIEGMPVLSLRPVRLSRSSRALKRGVDLILGLIVLAITAPLFAYVAWRIKRDSPGPVFFRQQRLGMNRREFTLFKFRTMACDTTSNEHEEYIRRSANGVVAPEGNGLFKLERRDAVTKVGAWLRRTSLDELPQLINVLRGEMSLVGPRPCLAYETEHFDDHHFERFAVPAGMTGLWQVTARAHATFAESLDMDVAYARGWSLGLDLRLLLKTPLQILRPSGTR
jgi:exopolysaccharide biosynthesis polyprenyl glycosylphosphotransferase